MGRSSSTYRTATLEWFALATKATPLPPGQPLSVVGESPRREQHDGEQGRGGSVAPPSASWRLQLAFENLRSSQYEPGAGALGVVVGISLLRILACHDRRLGQ